MPTDRKKPSEPTNTQGNSLTLPGPKPKYKPRRIRPTDHAKYYIVKQTGRDDIYLPLDANENRRQRQMDAAEYRGFLKAYIGELQGDKERIKDLKSSDVKRLGEALKIADDLDRMAWVDDIPLKPRTGSVDDLEELMENAVKAGMKMKAKIQRADKVIDADATDVTGTHG